MTLVGSLGIRGIPTFLFYKNGDVTDTLAGTQITKEQIQSKIEALLAA